MGKLSLMQVLEIAADRRPNKEVAAEYSISPVMVSLIRTGQRHSHRTGIEPVRAHFHLSDQDRAEIAASTESTSVLARRYAVHPSTIREVRRRPN